MGVMNMYSGYPGAVLEDSAEPRKDNGCLSTCDVQDGSVTRRGGICPSRQGSTSQKPRTQWLGSDLHYGGSDDMEGFLQAWESKTYQPLLPNEVNCNPSR